MSDNLSSHCSEFISLLASSAPVPGGGGAAALCAALSASLISMTGELSLGKKSTAAHSAELEALNAAAVDKAGRFLALIDEDAAAFEPLSKAYSIPKDAPDRAKVISEASMTAAAPPLRLLLECAELAGILERMAQLCSPIMLSDVGCAAALCRAAAECGAMNVYVNLPGIGDSVQSEALRNKADAALNSCLSRSQTIAQTVLTKLRG